MGTPPPDSTLNPARWSVPTDDGQHMIEEITVDGKKFTTNHSGGSVTDPDGNVFENVLMGVNGVGDNCLVVRTLMNETAEPDAPRLVLEAAKARAEELTRENIRRAVAASKH